MFGTPVLGKSESASNFAVLTFTAESSLEGVEGGGHIY